MRRYFRWLLDPCFHVLVIGIVLFQLVSLMGADADRIAPEPETCGQCNLVHEDSPVCPSNVAKVVTVSR